MLKNTLLTVAMIAMAASVHASAASLTVDVTAIKDERGSIVMAIYDAPDAYNGRGSSVKSVSIEVTGPEARITFDDLPPGRYAIKLYHDANSNGELDTNLMGLPIEAYGFSGEGANVGPPPFAAASFGVVVGDDNYVTVRLR